MSDLKIECPGCGSYTSNVGMDLLVNDVPCRYCGLTPETYLVVMNARQRGITADIERRWLEAVKRADAAELEAETLRRKLDIIRNALKEGDE